MRDLLSKAACRPHVLVELRDPTNADLFDDADTEVLASGEVVSHIVAQVALRGELRAVFDQLLGPDGPEIVFRPASELGLVGAVRFSDVLEVAAQRNETALGVRVRGDGTASYTNGGIVLNPARQRIFHLGEQDAVVVLTSYEETSVS